MVPAPADPEIRENRKNVFEKHFLRPKNIIIWIFLKLNFNKDLFKGYIIGSIELVLLCIGHTSCPIYWTCVRIFRQNQAFKISGIIYLQLDHLCGKRGHLVLCGY